MRKVSKMLLSISIVLPTLLSPLAVSANTSEAIEELRTRRQTREQLEIGRTHSSFLSTDSNDILDTMRTRRGEREPLAFEASSVNIDVQPFENIRLEGAIAARQALDSSAAGIESHIEDWTDEEIAAFDELINANDDAFFNLVFNNNFNLAFEIVHYYWLSLDFNVDLLEAVLGLSLDDFTEEDIRALEELIETFHQLDADFIAILNAVLYDGMSFEEASALMTENTDGFLALGPLFDEQLADITTSPGDSENAWTAEEVAAFNELLIANDEAFLIVDPLIVFAFRVVSTDPAIAEELFGFNADDMLVFEEMIDAFFAADDLFWDALMAVYEGNISFEDAAAMVTESTDGFIAVATVLEEFLSELRVEPWTATEFEVFMDLLLENDDAAFALMLPLMIVMQFQIELADEDQVTFNNIVAEFEVLDAIFFNVLADVSVGIISFENATAALNESTEGFQTLLAEVEGLFEIEPWTEEEVELFFAALVDSDQIAWDLLLTIDFAFTLLFYHEIGQNSDLDLVYILFGLTLTDEDVAAMEQIINDFWELDFTLMLLIELLFSETRILSFEEALEFNTINTEALLELESQILEIMDGHLEPPTLPPGTGIIPEEDALRELMFEIGLLQLEESEFTPESWSLFIDAIDAAAIILENAGDHDVAEILLAHENLQEAFDGLETISGEEPTSPTRPSFPEITLPEIVIPEITIPGIPTLPFSIGLKTL